MDDKTPVRIDQRLIGRISVREWGMPSMCIPGKIWRSDINGTITCMTAKGADRVNIETRPLIVVPPGEKQWMPDTWRAALWEYTQAWPHSGMAYGPWLAISEEQRCDFIRKMAEQLVKSDNIGCRHIANDIGEFAAHGYEIVEPKKVPKTVKMKTTVCPDYLALVGEKKYRGMAAVMGETYEVSVNQYGAVSVIIPGFEKHLGVKPDEFEVVEFHPARSTEPTTQQPQ